MPTTTVNSLQLDSYLTGTHPGAGMAWPAGALQCALLATMDKTTAADVTKAGQFGFEVSQDNENWSVASAGPYQGGPNTKLGLDYSMPSISPLAYEAGQTPPAYVRAFWVSTQGAVSVGLDLQFS